MYNLAIGVMLLHGEGEKARVLLGLRDGVDNGAGVWACPGGRMEADDASLLAGAARELREETGLTLHCPVMLSGQLKEGVHPATGAAFAVLYCVGSCVEADLANHPTDWNGCPFVQPREIGTQCGKCAKSLHTGQRCNGWYADADGTVFCNASGVRYSPTQTHADWRWFSAPELRDLVAGGAQVWDLQLIQWLLEPSADGEVHVYNGHQRGLQFQVGGTPADVERLAAYVERADQIEAELVTLREQCGPAAYARANLLPPPSRPGWTLAAADPRGACGMPSDLPELEAKRADMCATTSAYLVSPAREERHADAYGRELREREAGGNARLAELHKL